MSEAGPSGVRCDFPSMASPRTIDLDESLSAWHSPTSVTQDLPCSSPMPLPDGADGQDQYSLSAVCRSRKITERIEQICRVRWGTNHVQFIEWEEREEDEEEVSTTEENLNIKDEENGTEHDHDEPEDEEDMPFAKPGQEGISVWDLLGEGFMKEVAEIGWQFLNPF